MESSIGGLHRALGVAAAVLVLGATGTGLLLQFPHLLGPPADPPGAFAADPNDADRWLRGTRYGIEISTDRGRSWRETPMLRPPGEVLRIAFAPDDANTVYVLGADGLVVSHDSGRIWESVVLPPPPAEAWLEPLDLSVGAAGRIALLSAGGVLRSGDGGDTWSDLPWPSRRPDRDLHRVVHELHTGYWLGNTGRAIVSAGAFALLVLTLSGLALAGLRNRGRRRRSVSCVVGILALLLAGVSLDCRAIAAEQVDESRAASHEEARLIMGTLARVHAWAATESAAEAAVHAAFAAFVHVDSTLSTWRPDSELMRINAQAHQRPVPLSTDAYTVINAALEMARRSEGAFDPTVLPLVELWGFRAEGAVAVPSDSALGETLKKIGHQRVELDPLRRTLRFHAAGVRLDLGGIAKGYALDLAARAMREAGATGALLDLGGGLLLFGAGPEPLVAIVDPLRPGTTLGELVLREGAVATSGQYERNRQAEGESWGHILDPRDGRPCRGLLGVTVVAHEALLADAAATACFVLGAERGLALLESLPDCEGVLVVPAEGGEVRVISSSGLADFARDRI